MALGNFEKCHAVTAKWEGGWSNHPKDPGGKTMYGVTEAVYHNWLKSQGKAPKPVRNITKGEALVIYKNLYWDAAKCDTLAAGVDLAVYDASVNSGVSRGRKWLLASIGGTDVETIKKICAKRLSFLRALKTWATFGKGWLNRVVDVEAKSVAMNLAAKTNKHVTTMSLEREAEDANKKAKAQGASGAATGGGTAALSPEMADRMAAWALTGVMLVAVGFVVFLIVRSVINKKRAEAYAREAAA